MQWTAFLVFLLLFALVTVVGFASARWRRGDMDLLDEWGLAGRRLGTFLTWFLLGGDLYTAYTFIAVPALVYGAGALGFFAVPYTIILYPIMFVVMPRLWSVARTHGFVTTADFVRGRYQSSGLALAVAVTGILATMPYIALQLDGMQAVFATMGLVGTGPLKDLPLIVAFAILAAYTYVSGLRAPALTAVIKDLLIYLTIIVAMIVIPARLGGFGAVFHAAALALPKTKGALVLPPKLFSPFATLALGSAFALLLYPHVVTGTLGANSRATIQRNAAFLPAYSLLLAFLALLGFMALAAHIHTKVTSDVVPLLFLQMFPHWFAGVAFAAVAIGALVPAAIMAIAAANLFSRNIYREYFNPSATSRQETAVAKWVSLLVKVGAVVFVVAVPAQYAIYLQTLGGIWILQTLPAVIIGLYTRWLHRYALLTGWAAGMLTGTWMAYTQKFASSIYALHLGHLVVPGYAAVWALIVNLAVTVVLTVALKAARVPEGADLTRAPDYAVEASQASL
ncbi:MAG: sodium:solute symporter [Firmicutes bacterium]|nr:sodium:solute symporter [Bacillota bacterium]